jgi:hypothetical protein
MIFNRVFRSLGLPENLAIVALGILLCLPLLLSPKPYESAGAKETDFWVSIVLRWFFIVCSFLIFNNLRDKGGAAVIFFLIFYFLQNYTFATPLISHLNEVYLGLGFWAMIFFALFRVFERLWNTNSESERVNESDVQDNKLTILILND